MASNVTVICALSESSIGQSSGKILLTLLNTVFSLVSHGFGKVTRAFVVPITLLSFCQFGHKVTLIGGPFRQQHVKGG